MQGDYNMKIKNELSTRGIDVETMKRAAYALNMCTVSVAQIVDYNDEYVLEQEYDAILNNLNLEQIPKDEALLTILTELMNTITFFRIQEIKKTQIEKKYQRRISNAIWSAVPNIGLIVAGGDPVTMAISLASQVGIGYMNYRKEKANAAFDKENEKVELEITAIEQFNAIKRELFTTAWRLADTYQFPDQYRLTEKQIKQYNAILMDKDEIRKYERLETVQDNFQAYPPFWYFFGHTANYIAGCREFDLDEQTRQAYRAQAKNHFEHYVDLNKFNILREDRIASSCCLEYAEMLLLEGKEQYSKIAELSQEAIRKSGYDNDVLQIAALNYLRIGELKEAGRILKILVNENYNKPTNARLLSRIYVSLFMNTHDETLRSNYDILSTRVDRFYLFPFPERTEEDDEQLQTVYMAEQKSILQKEYRYAINEYIYKCSLKANRILSLPDPTGQIGDSYYSNDSAAQKKREADMEIALNGDQKQKHMEELRSKNFRREYIDLLNEMLHGLDELSIFSSDSDERRHLMRAIKRNIYQKREQFTRYQNAMDAGEFSIATYREWQRNLDFRDFVRDFTNQVKTNIMETIDSVETNDALDTFEFEVTSFCQKHNIDLKNVLFDPDVTPTSKTNSTGNDYLRYSMLGSDVADTSERHCFNDLISLVQNMASQIVVGPQVSFYVNGDNDFNAYFKNSALSHPDVREDTIAVVDDKSKKDMDLLLTRMGIVIVKNNNVQTPRDYVRISYAKYKNKETLQLGWPEVFGNESVNIGVLYELIEKIEETLLETSNGGKQR